MPRSWWLDERVSLSGIDVPVSGRSEMSEVPHFVGLVPVVPDVAASRGISEEHSHASAAPQARAGAQHLLLFLLIFKKPIQPIHTRRSLVPRCFSTSRSGIDVSFCFHKGALAWASSGGGGAYRKAPNSVVPLAQTGALSSPLMRCTAPVRVGGGLSTIDTGGPRRSVLGSSWRCPSSSQPDQGGTARTLGSDTELLYIATQ